VIIISIVSIDKRDFLPSKTLYLLRAGFKGRTIKADEYMIDLANKIYLEAIKLVDSKVLLRTYGIHDVSPLNLPESFSRCMEVTLFVSTLGKRIDDKINEYSNNGKTLQATLLDAWGSESVESINERVDERIREKMRRESPTKKGTRRFSPGYGSVSILENIKILRKLGCDFVDAKENSGVLIPVKSTTCMIGWC